MGTLSDQKDASEGKENGPATDKVDDKPSKPQKPSKLRTDDDGKPSMTDGNASFLRAARAGNLDKVLEYLKGSTDINTSNANGLNALHLSSKEGHLNIVTELLKRGANVNAATKKGNTALHIGALAGQEEIVKVLIDHGADVNVQSQNGFTPLYMAAQENHTGVVKYLLSHNADQNLATEDGFTPLAVALQQGHDKVVAVLLENDRAGKTRLPALHIAARKDDTKAAALLLQSGHNPDVTSKSGFTPLHIAAHYGHVNVATLLLQKGATVDYSARNHITPLHVAAKWGRVNMVNTLLDRGAKIDAKTRDGLTPLHCSARSGHDQCVDQLLERGAPISTKTKSGLAPLHMAAQGDHVDSARLLLFHKAPVDDVTVDYLTPLHVAAHCGHHRVAKLLLDRKATPDARALNGFTPLHIACKKNRIKVIELLLKYGASIHATTESGLTPLHAAAFMGNVQIVPYLIKHGAKVNETNVRGETPLHLAARSNQIDVMKILIDNGATVDARAHENQTPLHIAARLGNAEIVTLLLENGANADAQTRDQYTALHIAAREGKEDVAAVLLDRGATLSMKTKKDFTPLHVAAKYGRLEVASLLLRNYAAPDAKAQNGLTPLHIAAHYDNVDVAMLLLDHGASPHTAAKNGFTPLHIAAKKNQMDVATTLLEYGAEPNATTKHGISPVHLAALEGHSDMLSLLLERGAKPNIVSKNGLTPLHLAAQEDQLNCAVILVNNNAEIDPKTKAGYTPLHVACHYGNIKTATYLLEHNANVHEKTKHGLTPLHQGAQQGHVGIVNTLLTHNADPNEKANNGYTPLAIAKRLGYISVVNTLTIVTEETEIVVSPNDEKLKVQVPETMQVNFMSDSDDEGDDVSMTGDQIVLSPQEIRTMADDSETARKSWEDDWMREPNMNYFSGVGSLSGHYSMSSPQGTYLNVTSPSGYSTLDSRYGDRSTNGDITIEGEAPIVMSTDTTLESAPPMLQSTPNRQFSGEADNDTGPRSFPTFHGFLISFIVDARGGTMRSKRLPGLRLVVPPKRASGPTRVTCRLIKRNKLQTPPPLVENEALSTRVIEVGPSNTQFLGPVLLEVPHFASLRGNEREIVVLRSDNGETWREHSLGATEEEIKKVMDGYEAEDEKLSSDKRICRIITKDFPQYFAIISRVRQETNIIGTQGGMLNSTVVPQVQAVFPEGTLTKKIKVGLQAQPVSNDVVKKVLGNRVMVSPIVTIEPRRRKFHKPITVTIPVPTAYNQGVNTYGGDTPTLRLLCSISGGTAPAQWEDITGTTPLTFVNDCVSFTTTVSARFWLMDCKEIDQASNFARELYQELKAVPFMSKFVVFAKTHDPIEARVRVFCVTDDKIDKPLEQKEEFKEVARSKDVEVMDGRPVYFELAGNLVPVQKSGEQLHLNFHAFHENRLPFFVRVRDQTQEPCGRLSFMREPRVQRGLPPQVPVCSLNVTMPPYVKVKKATDSESESESESEDEDYKMEKGEREQYQQDILLSNLNFDYIKDKKKYTFPEESSRSPETQNKPEIILWDISNKLGSDWPALGRELGINDREIKLIENENDDLPEQAFVVMHLWAERQGPTASTAPLADALQSIGRGDIVDQCLPEDKPLDVTVTSTTSFSPLRSDLESPRDGHTDITIDITGDIDEHFAEKHEEEQKEVEPVKVKIEESSPEEPPKEPTLIEDPGQMEDQKEPVSQETTTIKEVTKQKVVHFEEHVYVETGREELKPDIEDIRDSDDLKEDVPVEEMPVEVSTLEVSEIAPKKDEEDTELAVEEIPVTETKEEVEESPRPMQEDDEERTIALVPEAETVPVETKEVLEQIVAKDEERQDVFQDIYSKQVLTEVTVTEQVVVESTVPSKEEEIPSETIAQAVIVSKEIPDEETDLKEKKLEDELPKETSDEPDVVGERIDEEEAEKPVETIEEEEMKEIPQESELDLGESVVSVEEERLHIPDDSGLPAEEPTETVEEEGTEKIPDTSVPEQLDVTEEQQEHEPEKIISVVSIQDERTIIQEETEKTVETFETQDQVGTEESHEEYIPVSEPGGVFIEETHTEEEREVPQDAEQETIVSVVTVEEKMTDVQEESVPETDEPVQASDEVASEEIPEEPVPESEPVEAFEEEKDVEEIPEEREPEQVVSVEEKKIDTQEETLPETEEPVETADEVITEEVLGEPGLERESVEAFEEEEKETVEVPEEHEPEQIVSVEEKTTDVQEEAVLQAEEPVQTSDEVVTEEIPEECGPVAEREPVELLEGQKETGDIPEESGPEQFVSLDSVEEKIVDTKDKTVPESEEPVETIDEVVTEKIPDESVPEGEPVEAFEEEREVEKAPEETEPEQAVLVEEKTVDIQEELVPETEPKTEETVETMDEVVTEEIPDKPVPESEPVDVCEVQKETEDTPEESGPKQVVSLISVEEKTLDTRGETVPEIEEPVGTTSGGVTEEIPYESVTESERLDTFEGERETEEVPEEGELEKVVSIEEETKDIQEDTVPEAEEPVDTTDEVTAIITDEYVPESETGEAFEGEKETEKTPEETEPEQIVSVVSLEEKTVDIQEEHVPETEESVQASDERVTEPVPEHEPVEVLQKVTEDTPEDSAPKHSISVEEEKTTPVQEETSPKTEEHVETTDEVVTEEVPDKSVPQSEPVETFEEEETEDIPEESGTEQVVSVEEQTRDIEKETVPETEEPAETTDEVVPEVIPDESILKRESLEEFEGDKEVEEEEVPEEREEEQVVSFEEKAVDIQEETVPETDDLVTEESLDESVPESKPEEVFEEEKEAEKVPEESEPEQVAEVVLIEEKTPQIEGLVETTDKIVTDEILGKSAPKDEPSSEEREPEEIVSVVSIEEEKSEVQVDSALESERPVDKIEVSTEESPGDGGFIVHDHEKKEPGTEEIVTEDIPKESLSEDEETDVPDGIVPDQVEAIDAFEEEQKGHDTPSEEPLHTFDSTTDEPGLREEECTEPFQEVEGSGDIPEETDARAEEPVESTFDEDETIDQEREVTSAIIFHEKDEPIMTLEGDKTSHESTEICLPREQQELDEVPREEEKFLGIPDEIYEPGEDPEEGLFEHEEPKEDLTTDKLVDKEYPEEHKLPDEPEKDEQESETQEEVMDFTTEETALEDEELIKTEDEVKVVEALPEEIIPEQDEEVEEYEVDAITKDTVQSGEEPVEPATEDLDDVGPREDVVEDVEDVTDEQFQDDTYSHERYFEELQNIPEEPEEVSGEDSPARDSTDMVPEDTGITDSVVQVEETRQTIVKEDESGMHTESFKTVVTTTARVVSSSETLMDEYPVEGRTEQEPCETKTEEEAPKIPSESLETFEEGKPLQEEDYPLESEDVQEGAFTSQVEEPHVDSPEKMEERKPDEEFTPLEHEITDEPQPGEHVRVQETRQTIVKEDESGVHTESVKTVITTTTTTRVVSSSERLMGEYPVEGTVEQPEEEPKAASEPMGTFEESRPIGEEDYPMEPEDVPEDVPSSQVEEPFAKTPDELEESKPDELAPLEHEGRVEDESHPGEHVHVEETRQTIMKEDDSGVQTESVKTVITTTTQVVSSSERLMDEYPVEGTVEQPEEEEPKIASEPMGTFEESRPIGEEDYPMEPEDVPEDVSSSHVEEHFVKTPDELEESKPDELAPLEHEGRVEDASHPGEHVHVEETRQTIMKEDDSGVQTESVKTVITTTRVVSSSERLMDEYPVEGTVEQPEEEEPKISSEPMGTFEESRPIGEGDYPMEPEDVPEDVPSSQVEEHFVKTPDELEESKPDGEPTLSEHEPHTEDTVQQEVVEDEEVQPQFDADEEVVTEETPEVKEDFGTNEDEVEIEMEAVEENIKTEISPDDENEVFAPPKDLRDQGDDALGIPPGEEYFTQTTEVRIHTEITTSEGTRIHDERKVIEDGEVKVDVKIDTVKGDSEGEKLLGAVKDDGIDETELGSQPSAVMSDEFTGQDAQKSVVMKEGSLPDDEDVSSEEGEYMPEIRVDPSSEYIQPKEDEDEPDHGTDGLLVEPDPFTEESDVSMDEREVTREPADEQPDEDDLLPDTERTESIETSMSHTQILQGGVVSHTETHVILSGDTAKPSDQEPQDEEPETKETDQTPVIHDELLEQSIILKSEVCLESSPREEKEEPEDRPKTPEIADITEHEEFSPYFQDQEYHHRVSDIQVPDADVEVEFPEISPEDDVEMDLPEPPLHPYAEDQESDLPSREVHSSTTVITSTVRHISSGPDGSVTETSTRTVTRYEDGEKITAPTELRFEEAPPVGADSVQTPEIQELPDTPDSIPGSPLIGAAYVSQQQVLDSSFQEKEVMGDEPQDEQEPVTSEDIEIPGEAAVAPVFMDGPTESDYYDANLLVTHRQLQQDDTDRVEPDAPEPVQEESLDVGADQEHSAEEVLDEAVASQDEPHQVEVEEPSFGVDVSLEQRDEERCPPDEPEQQPESGVEAERDQRRDEGESILSAGAVGMSLSVLSMETKSGSDEAEGIEEGVRPEVERPEDQIESEEVESEEKKRDTLEESLPESERAADALDQVYDETPQYTTQPEEYSRGDEGEETEPESEQAFAAEIAPEGSVTMESGDDILESELTEEHEMPLEEPVEEETPAEIVTDDQQIERDFQTQEVLVETQDEDVSKHISVSSMTSTQTVFHSTLLTAEGFVTEEDELADSIVKPTPPEDVEKAEGELKTPDEEEKDEVPEVLKKTEESEQLEEGKEVDDVDSPTKPVAVPVSEREQTTKMVTEGEQQMVVSQLISLEVSSAPEGGLNEPPVDESLDAPLRIGQDEESKPRMDPSTVQDLADIMNEMDSGGPAEDEEVPEDYDTGELIEEQSVDSREQSQPPEEAPKVRLTPEDEKELQELWSMEWPDPGEKPISSNMAQQAESAPPASSGPQEESAPPPQRVIQVESAPQPQDSYQVESGPPGDSEDPDGGRLVINFNPGAQTGPTGFKLTPERERELQEFWEEGTKDQPSAEKSKEEDDGPKVMEDVTPRGLPPPSTHRKFNLTEDDEKKLQEFWEEEPPAPDAEPEQSQPTADGIQLVPGEIPPGDDDVTEEVEVEEFEEELPDGTIRKVIRKRIKRSTVQMVPIEVDPANLPPGGTHNIVVHKKVTKNTVVRDGEEVDTTENVETEIEQDGIVTDAAELRDDLQQLVDQFLSDGTVDGAQIISDEQEVVDESDI